MPYFLENSFYHGKRTLDLAPSVQSCEIKWISHATHSEGQVHSKLSKISHFPQTEFEFQGLFPDEESCVTYLFHTKWSHGFECPNCMSRNDAISPRKSITCPQCGSHTSLTTDTVMHGTKKNLYSWLLAIWWLCTNEGGTSAKDLQRLLGLASYQTAWTWMQKLRMVMAAADSIPCHGLVQVGSAEVSPAWEKPERARVITAAETLLPSGITGRIRMQVIDLLSATSVTAFLRTAVQSGSSIVAPGLPPYADAEKYGSIYVIDSPTENPDRISEILSSVEIWLNKVHRGGVAIKHLQHYLDEFCFRNNSIILPDKQSVFIALLKGCMAGKTMPYRELVSDQH